MKKLLASFLLCLFSVTTFAAEPNYTKLFQNKSACFILYDATQHKLVSEYNPARCKEKITPASTFKVPLSIMAFDQKIITQKTIFKWDGQNKGMSTWNQNQTPYTWLKNSVVWVSQMLTPQLGIRKIKTYLAQFHYGNQDFSGDPYKHNGLTHAWLDSSLKISANEQLDLLKGLVANSLPVSQDALNNTKQNMFLENFTHSYKLFGKSGSWDDSGWFIGYIQNAKQTYIFVLNFSDLKPTGTPVAGGMRAKSMVESILSKTSLS
jgi:beta-lactamase class D